MKTNENVTANLELLQTGNEFMNSHVAFLWKKNRTSYYFKIDSQIEKKEMISLQGMAGFKLNVWKSFGCSS